MDLNTFSFTGRLGADPESRYTKNGKEFVRLRVAVGTGRDETLWLTAFVYGKSAEFAKGLSKGDRVAISGRLSAREWEGKTYIEVQVNSLVGLGGSRGGGDGKPAIGEKYGDDDIPF